MSDENIVKMFAGDGSVKETRKDPDPQTFEIELKDGKVFTETGYLALGAYVAILERPNDVMSITFAANPGDINYVVRTDEVVDDE